MLGRRMAYLEAPADSGTPFRFYHDASRRRSDILEKYGFVGLLSIARSATVPRRKLAAWRDRMRHFYTGSSASGSHIFILTS